MKGNITVMPVSEAAEAKFRTEENESYIGSLEVIGEHRASGWALRKISDGHYTKTSVQVSDGIRSISIDADLSRVDLQEKFDINFGAFDIDIQDIGLSKVESVKFSATGEALNALRASGSVDSIDGALCTGWACDKNKRMTTADFFVDGNKIKEIICTQFREDLQSPSLNNGYVKFVTRMPGAFRSGGLHKVEVKVDGISLGAPITRRFGPIRALIVSETENLEDASRYYRCENLKTMLVSAGIDVSIIGPGEFNTKEWCNYDVIVLSRVGIDAILERKIQRYRANYGTKIVYEIDDLVFLPWHTHDLGSVRSGIDRADDKNLVDMFRRRLRAINVSDYAITSTETIRDRIESLGVPCYILRNAMRHEYIETQRARKGPLSILCMSGSPTHYADFALIERQLELFLERNRENVSLTLLGRFRDNLPIQLLPNVRRIDRVPYSSMLEQVSQHDVCLVPLEQTDFNDAKSCLKYIECGARGVPVIASAVADYKRVITNDENGVLIQNDDQWLNKLNSLLNNRTLLRQMGQNAFNNTFASYSISAQAADVVEWMTNEVCK